MTASGEWLRPIVVLSTEHTFGPKAKGNAVDKSPSKAESCSSSRFSTSLRSAPGRLALSNRRQRQISFRSHLISLSVSSIEVITDVRPWSIKHGDRRRAAVPRLCIPAELSRGLATSSVVLPRRGEQFGVCNSYQSISPYTARVTINRGRSSRFHGAAIVCPAQFQRSTGLVWPEST